MGRVQGEGGREKKWERQGGQAGRKDELERQWTPGVNVKWEVEQLVQKRNTLHAAQPLSHITFHFHPKSPSPRFQLAGFPASPPALAELGIGLGLRVPKGAGALALSLEAAGKHTAKRRCAAQDGSVETGLAKLIPGRWNGPPRECQAQCGSKTDRRNAAHGVTEGNWGISQSTNPVQLDGAIHAAPPSAALISTDRK